MYLLLARHRQCLRVPEPTLARHKSSDVASIQYYCGTGTAAHVYSFRLMPDGDVGESTVGVAGINPCRFSPGFSAHLVEIYLFRCNSELKINGFCFVFYAVCQTLNFSEFYITLITHLSLNH